METVDQIINAKWIITCEKNNAVLTDHALVFKDGLIKDIAPSSNIKKKYTSSTVLDYTSHAVIPGFVN